MHATAGMETASTARHGEARVIAKSLVLADGALQAALSGIGSSAATSSFGYTGVLKTAQIPEDIS
jgi:hypothetical protein